MSAADRRAHPRLELQIDVQFRGDGTKATTRDVSLGGCAILAPRMRLVNERLFLNLSHPSIKIDLEVTAEVKRAIELPDGKWLLGVQFVDLTGPLPTRIREFVDAIANARPTAGTSPEEISRRLREAEAAENSGNVAEAVKLLDQVLKDVPKRADILVSRARLAAKTGDVTAAAAFAKKAMELEPANTAYSQLYQRFTTKQAKVLAAANSIFPPGFTPPGSEKKPSFLPADRRIQWAIGAAVLLVALWVASRLFT